MESSVGKRIDVAVFPLANAVLFPGVSLPLHVFEGRYEKMLEDVHARGWQLAVSLVEASENPSEFVLNSICGAGEVQIFREYPNGASDILVHGKQRVKLLNFIQQEPYLVMEAEIIRPIMVPRGQDAKQTAKGALAQFQALAKTWAFLNPQLPQEAPFLFQEIKDLGQLCDFFVFHFLKRPLDKQVYLNNASANERAEMLTHYLETDLLRLTRKVNRHKRSLLMH